MKSKRSKILLSFIMLVYAIVIGGLLAAIIEVPEARLSTILLSGTPATTTIAGCTTANDSVIFNYINEALDSASAIRASNSNVLYAQMELGATSYTITEYAFHIRDIGSQGNCQGALYEDSADEVGSMITGTDVDVDHTEIDGSDEVQLFTLGTPKTGVTGTVWVGFTAEGNPDAYFLSWFSPEAGLRVLHTVSTYADNYTLPVDVWGCEE